MPGTGLKRLLRRAALLFVVIAALAGGWAFYLLRSEPQVWVEHQQFIEQTSPQQRRKMAGDLEKRLMTVAGLLGGPKSAAAATGDNAAGSVHSMISSGSAAPVDSTVPHRVVVSVQELNALLAERFNEWAQERGYDVPAEITSPMIAFESERITGGFKFAAGEFSQVFTAAAKVSFEPDGLARVRVEQFHAGRLPIPAGQLSQYIRDSAPRDSNVQRAAEWAEKMKDFQFKPTIKLPSRHRANIGAYRVLENGRIELTMYLEPPTKY